MRIPALLIGASVIAVLLVSGCVQDSDPGTPGNGGTFTLEEIADHGSADDCWLALDGNVYDVTGFIGSHPGGAALLEGCGKDATELYETRPMGSGTPHSQNARNLLPTYLIGELE